MNRRSVLAAAAVVLLLAIGVTAYLWLGAEDDAVEIGESRSTEVPTDTSVPDRPVTDVEPPGDEGGASTSTAPDEPSSGDGAPGTSEADDDAQGTVHEEAEVIPGTVADPVALDATADVGDGVRVRLEMEAVHVEAHRPGERSGPGLAVTVEMRNDTASTVDLDGVTVDLRDAQDVSATQVVDPGRETLHGALAPGETRAGTYVFELPADRRTGVSVSVKYAAEAPTVVFAGDAPGG